MTVALRGTRLLVLFFLTVSFAVAEARAQADVCEPELAEAEELYRDGRFEDAAELLTSCLDGREGVRADVALRGYRLLALAHLQNGDIAGARIAVVRVLARDPDYEADPVIDPPGYQALVETVRTQLATRDDSERIDVPRTIEAEPSPPVGLRDSYRRPGAVTVRAFLGVSSYGGDRGTPEENVFVDFVANAGTMLGLAMDLALHEYAGVHLYYETAYTPSLFESRARVFPPVDPDVSSRWIQTLGIQAVGRILGGRQASPYVRVGPGISIARLNDEVRVGTALDLAAGADLRIRHDVGLFAETGARWVFPGDAMDLVAWDHDYDLFAQVRIGVIWRVGGLF
jgi:hypothetical protein